MLTFIDVIVAAITLIIAGIICFAAVVLLGIVGNAFRLTWVEEKPDSAPQDLISV